MSKPYRPSNHTEADFFIDDWCNHCKHDYTNREDGQGCMILARTFWTEITSPHYPREWIVDDNGIDNPRCIAFEAKHGS